MKLKGEQLSSGVYFYRLQNESKAKTLKMMLLKEARQEKGFRR